MPIFIRVQLANDSHAYVNIDKIIYLRENKHDLNHTEVRLVDGALFVSEPISTIMHRIVLAQQQWSRENQ